MEATKNISQEVVDLLAKGNQILAEGQAILKKEGKEYDLGEWITPAEYVRRYNLQSTMVISNWIRRGIIPSENIVTVPEFNDIRLIKAVPYRGE